VAEHETFRTFQGDRGHGCADGVWYQRHQINGCVSC